LATLLFAALALFPPGRFVEALPAFGGRFEFEGLFAATAFLPLNSPGLALAATAGRP